MSWLIVVGVLIAAALGIHLAEQRRSRAVIAARHAARLRENAELRYFKCSVDVREEWYADFEAMSLEVERKGVTLIGEMAQTFRLARSAEGVWQATPRGGSGDRTLASPVVEQLEAQYQRFLSRLAKQQSGK